MNRKNSGFTLLEMAVVLFIAGALFAATLTPLRVQLESRARRATEVILEQSVEGLYGFALAFARLPCPDAEQSSNGREDRLGTRACLTNEGFLPYVDLGVPGYDAWGNRVRYRVTAATSLSPGSGANFAATDDGICRSDDGDLDLCEMGDVEIRTRGDNPATPLAEGEFDFVQANAVPAVVLSHGANGYGAVSQQGRPRARVPARNRDESENVDSDAVFYARIYAADQSPCNDDENESVAMCEFDDILRWLSPTILNNRLVSAGQLP